MAKWIAQWSGAPALVGAEDQAWALSLALEAHGTLGQTVGGAAFDWSKAFDYVAPDLLGAACVEASVPEAVWRPALQAYRAPRRLRVREARGASWLPTSGLLPGCALAVFLLGGHRPAVAGSGCGFGPHG